MPIPGISERVRFRKGARQNEENSTPPVEQVISPLMQNFVRLAQNERFKKPPKFRFGYLFGGVIGRGSYAVVKEIIDETTLMRRAVKIIRGFNPKKEPQRLEAVQREIRVLKRVSHTNVVKLIEVVRNTEKNKTYLVLEFCLGNVNQLVKASPREQLSESDAHFLFTQLIDGMEYLHSLGIVHKDIKPHNLLLTGDFVLKISDFGVSEELSIFQEDDLCHKVYGTLTFQAPEMISSDCFTYSGFKVDIWAAGITLYFMLSGEFPFEEDAVIALMDSICTQSLRMPKSALLGEDVEKFLRALLDKSADTRPGISELRKFDWYMKAFPPEFARFMGAYDALMKRSPKVNQDLETLFGNRPMVVEDGENSADCGKLKSSASDPSLATPVKKKKTPRRTVSHMIRRRSSLFNCIRSKKN